MICNVGYNVGRPLHCNRFMAEQREWCMFVHKGNLCHQPSLVVMSKFACLFVSHM